MTQRRHIPIRTCVACRKKREKGKMIWLTQGPEGVVRVDGRKPHRGRGFYLCADLQCLNTTKGRKKAVQFSGKIDFQSFLKSIFSESDQVYRGGRE